MVNKTPAAQQLSCLPFVFAVKMLNSTIRANLASLYVQKK